MDAQEILKSLSTLEQNLQNIDSARQQVEAIVNAYKGTRDQLTSLSQEFSDISTELATIFKSIESNQDSLSKEISAKVKSSFEGIDSKITELSSAADAIKTDFNTACNNAGKEIVTSVGQSVSNLNNGVSAAIQQFNEKATFEIDGIASVLAGFKTASEEMQKQFKTEITNATTNQKTTQEGIASNFQTSIDNHVSSFTKLTGNLKAVLDEYKELNTSLLSDIDSKSTGLKSAIITFQTENKTQYEDIEKKLRSLRDGDVKAANNLSERFNTVDQSIEAVKTSVDALPEHIDRGLEYVCKSVNNNTNDSCKKLKSEIDALKEENASMKKLVFYCLVAIIISLILGIITILH